MSHRVLIAGIYHETHTFLDGLTDVDDFQALAGDDLLSAAGDASPLGGVLDFARDARWDVVPAIDMRAMPGPLVADGVVERFWQVVHLALREGGLEDGRIDGVLLVLHGAMVAESFDDVEGAILERVWNACGGGAIPVVAVLDLHANLSAHMVRHCHGLIAYRQNPHADARDAAIDAARLLDRLMETGERPVTLWHQTAIMWPPTGTGTDADPMKSLEEAAREIERRHDAILAVNVLAGFAFADTLDAGVSFSATTTGDPAQAQAHLQALGELATAEREAGNQCERSAADVFADIRARPFGTIVIAEPSDNIGAGASGAGTGLLRVFLDQQIVWGHGGNGAVVTINDPEAVQTVRRLRPGDSMIVPIGRKATLLDPDPVDLDVTLVSVNHGAFELEDRQSHLASMFGSRIDMGPCAVVRHQGIRILLTSRKTPPFDLGQLRSQGIEPSEAFIIGVKAAVAHRRAYDRIARTNFIIATPGPCASNLRDFSYRKVRRPIYPLDP